LETWEKWKKRILQIRAERRRFSILGIKTLLMKVAEESKEEQPTQNALRQEVAQLLLSPHNKD
jgi:hypothetical protein